MWTNVALFSTIVGSIWFLSMVRESGAQQTSPHTLSRALWFSPRPRSRICDLALQLESVPQSLSVKTAFQRAKNFNESHANLPTKGTKRHKIHTLNNQPTNQPTQPNQSTNQNSQTSTTKKTQLSLFLTPLQKQTINKSRDKCCKLRQ